MMVLHSDLQAIVSQFCGWVKISSAKFRTAITRSARPVVGLTNPANLCVQKFYASQLAVRSFTQRCNDTAVRFTAFIVPTAIFAALALLELLIHRGEE